MNVKINISEDLIEVLSVIMGKNDITSEDVENYLYNILYDEMLNLLCRYNVMKDCLERFEKKHNDGVQDGHKQ